MKRKSMSEALRKTALGQFISTIENTGGVRKPPGESAAPVADEDWIDLGETYLQACAEVGRRPMIVK